MNLEKMESYLRVNLLGPGPRLVKKEFTGPRSHKGWETLSYTTAGMALRTEGGIIYWKKHVLQNSSTSGRAQAAGPSLHAVHLVAGYCLRKNDNYFRILYSD